MPRFIRMDIYQITERRNGAIFKTRKIGSDWFNSTNCPESNIPDGQDRMYVATLDEHYGPHPPKEER